MATVLSSGCIRKASGPAMNFSPLFRFKYSYKKRTGCEFSLPCAHVSSSSSASCTVLWCWQGHCLSNYQHISLSQYQNSTYFSRTSFLCYPGTLFHLKSGPLTQMYKLLHVLVLKVLPEKLSCGWSQAMLKCDSTSVTDSKPHWGLLLSVCSPHWTTSEDVKTDIEFVS